MISFEDFAKVELKIGTILEAEEVEGSEKLVRLKVDLGEGTPRQILAGVRQWYKAADLVGRQVVVVANLEPRTMMGLESNGMVLAAGPSTAPGTGSDDGPVFLTLPKEVPPGTKVR